MDVFENAVTFLLENATNSPRTRRQANEYLKQIEAETKPKTPVRAAPPVTSPGSNLALELTENDL